MNENELIEMIYYAMILETSNNIEQKNGKIIFYINKITKLEITAKKV